MAEEMRKIQSRELRGYDSYEGESGDSGSGGNSGSGFSGGVRTLVPTATVY